MKTNAIITDLDGTAVDSPHQKLPSERLTVATKALQSQFYICAATGRSWSFAKPVLQGMGLTDKCIISGGTQICDPQTGEIVWQKSIDEKALKEVLKIFAMNNAYKVLHNDISEDEYFYGGVFPSDFLVQGEINFLEQAFVPDDIAEKVYEQLKSVDGIACSMVVAQKPGMRDLHITHREATKEHAVAVLLEMVGLDREHTIGIGDGHNDLHLFNAVHHRVAMGNAVDALKAHADEVIGSVADDGLAEYFERLAS